MSLPLNPTAQPKIYPSWPSPFGPDVDFNLRENTLATLEEATIDHVRDLGRIASWTIDRLGDANVEPDTTIESLTTHTTYARGWRFWDSPQHYSWTLLQNATLISGVWSGGALAIVSREPELAVVDFDSGFIRQDVEGSTSHFGATNDEILSVLSLSGVVLERPPDASFIARLFPTMGRIIAQHRATEGWRNVFRVFLKNNNLPLPPPDL